MNDWLTNEWSQKIEIILRMKLVTGSFTRIMRDGGGHSLRCSAVLLYYFIVVLFVFIDFVLFVSEYFLYITHLGTFILFVNMVGKHGENQAILLFEGPHLSFKSLTRIILKHPTLMCTSTLLAQGHSALRL